MEGSHGIRYVCLSDLHLGEDNGILTRFPGGPKAEPTASPVLDQLVRCLRSLVPGGTLPDSKPVLVLAGDIVDLALAPDSQALMAFRHFVRSLVEGEAPFKEIVYVPGNHDHRIWTTARDSKFAMDLARLGPTGLVKDFPHSTLVGELVPAYVLNKLLAEVTPVTVAYPNHAVSSVAADGASRSVVFTHGHFVDGYSWLMSTLVSWAYPGPGQNDGRPTTTEEWEEQNGSWIDFLWSTMGSCGSLGVATEVLWDSLHDKASRDTVAGNLVDAASHKLFASHQRLEVGAKWVGRRIAPRVVDTLAARLTSERGSGQTDLRDKGRDLLWEYVRTPLLKQLGDPAPDELTVVLGHTHKPMDFQGGCAEAGTKRPVNVYNTGGWVVDGPEANPRYGADLVVVDDKLDAAAITLFRQGRPGLKPEVTGAREQGQAEPPLFDDLKQLVAGDEWQTFPEEAAKEADRRLQRCR
jgi:hypothetical protein